MAIADGLVCQVYPVAGETSIKNIVDGTLFTGTGTPSLVDEGSEKAWSLTTGTLLEATIPTIAVNGGIDNDGATIAIRFKSSAIGSDSFTQLAGARLAASTIANGIIFSRNGSGSYRGRFTGSFTTTVSSKPDGAIYTFVFRTSTSATNNNDYGKMWINTVGRVGTAPDFTSTVGNIISNSFDKAFINCQTNSAFRLLDLAIWDIEKPEEDCSAIADDYRAVMPAPGGGSDVDPPTFTVAPAASAIGQTSATVTATINETGSIFWVAVPQGDATPSVAQVIAGQNSAGAAPIDAGSAVGTTSLSEVASGFTAATDYKFCVVARDDETTPNVQAAVTVVNFTTAAAGDTTPPVFTVAPAVTSVSQTTATVSATIDETGSIFWVVVPNAESTPSAAQVIAGQNAAGGTPTDTGGAVGTTTLSEGAAGMTASTAYKACFIARDDEGVPNVQATVTTVGFTTASVPVGTITLIDLADNTGTLWSNLSGIDCIVMNEAATSIVVAKTGLTSDAGGDVTFNDAAITAGTWYTVVIVNGTNRGVIRIQAT